MPKKTSNRFSLSKADKQKYADLAGVGIKSIERRIREGWPLSRLGEPSHRPGQSEKSRKKSVKYLINFFLSRKIL